MHVALDSNNLVVGAYSEDGANFSGVDAAYIYKKDEGVSNNWVLVKKLIPEDGAKDDYFGGGLAIRGNYIVVGAHGKGSGSGEVLSKAGAAYAYKYDEGVDEWLQVAKFEAPVPKANSNFGWSVSVGEGYLVIGAYQEDVISGGTLLENAGAVHVFKQNDENWEYFKTLQPSIAGENDNFGRAVSISADYIFVSTPYEDEDEFEGNTLSDAGSAYIFNKNQGGNDNWGQVQKTVTMDRAASDVFGSGVAISGNYAIVGAAFEDEDENGQNPIANAGAVYIMYNNAGKWEEIKKLCAPDRAQINANFGMVIAINDQYAVVGVPSKSENGITNSGVVYLFKKDNGGVNNWGFERKITAPDAAVSDYFGSSVALTSDYLVVGASQKTVNSQTFAGAAYIFEKDYTGSNNWGMRKKITALNTDWSDYFGTSVAIDGDYAVVGALYEGQDANEANTINQAGAAYIFKKDSGGANNWGQIKKIVAADRVEMNQFGSSVAVSGENVVVGEFGSAYVFCKDQGGSDNWGQLKKLQLQSPTAYDRYGVSVAIGGSYIVVGANGIKTDANGNNPFNYSGAAFIYEKDQGGVSNWGEVKKITSTVRAADDNFGFSVAISGNQVIVSSRNDDEDSKEQSFIHNAGSVYFFERACSEPLTLSSSNITNKTATISWAEPLSVPAGGYEYYYSTSNSTPADNVTVNGSMSAGVTSANVSGLQPATTYYFWVRSSCSVGYSSVWVAGGGFTTEACPATIAELTIPTEVGTYQSVNTIQEGNLTHYCDCADNLLLLTLDKTGSGAVIPDNGIKVKVGGGASYYTNGTGFVTNTHGTAMFNRWWSVTPTTQPTASVKVRTYYTTGDYTAVNGTLTSNGKAPMGSESQMFFYKVTDTMLGEFPAVSAIGADKVVLITTGLSAGLSSWVKGTFGEDSYAEFLVSSFSGGGGGGSPSEALPVTLVSFNARKNEQEVHLSWSTSSESNTSYFAIERSVDGRVWNKIGDEPATGESTGLKNYTYSDVRPFSGKNYYRLRTIDRDGTFALSRIEQVTFSGEGTLVLYPNPVSDKLYLKGVGEINSVSIINGLGQVVLQTSGFPKEGISTAKLSSGLYSVQLNRADGSSQYYKVVVIK
jgi:hypothetical protein